MITAGWLLYAVVMGGVLGEDLTIFIKEYEDYPACNAVADDMNADELMKDTPQYEYYCIKNPTERA